MSCKNACKAPSFWILVVRSLARHFVMLFHSKHGVRGDRRSCMLSCVLCLQQLRTTTHHYWHCLAVSQLAARCRTVPSSDLQVLHKALWIAGYCRDRRRVVLPAAHCWCTPLQGSRARKHQHTLQPPKPQHNLFLFQCTSHRSAASKVETRLKDGWLCYVWP